MPWGQHEAQATSQSEGEVARKVVLQGVRISGDQVSDPGCGIYRGEAKSQFRRGLRAKRRFRF
jgi:hypothetical protein